MKQSETQIWSNWSGSLKFTPHSIAEPENEEELAELIKAARNNRKKVRVAGAGHSSSPLVFTNDQLVSLSKFCEVEVVDRVNCQATIGSGLTVKGAGIEILKEGLSMHNTGDVDVQTVAGAIGTGTHGTGIKLQNLSTMLIGGRFVNGKGEIKDFSIEEDVELLKALRVGLGTCGIFTSIKLQLEEKFKLHRKEIFVDVETCMQHLDQWINNNRNFDFYWYPRSDCIKVRMMNKPGEPFPEVPNGVLDKEMHGWSNEILPRQRQLKFDEMEYSLPFENGPACFQEIREVVKEKYRKHVAWRVLYRTIAPDDAFLSTTANKPTVTISLHQNAGMAFWDYFKGIEPIFLKYGGRPHWGKKHTLKANELKYLYSGWDDFMKIRENLDPDNVFITEYFSELLGIKI